MSTVKASLERLKHEVDSNKRQKELATLINSHLDTLGHTAAIAQDVTSSADTHWLPFKMALQLQQPPKTREVALDCIQKLLGHQLLRGACFIDYLPGDVVTPSSTSATSTASPSTDISETNNSKQLGSYPPMLIDDIIHTVCMASPLIIAMDDRASQQESSVHLQIIKVLLTAVTSASCEIHEATLLKSLQACVNIYLHSKSLINHTTAKAGLTQMLHFVFSQMEERCATDITNSSQTTSTESHIEEAETSPSSDAASISTASDTKATVVDELKEEAGVAVPLPTSKENDPYNMQPKVYAELLVRDAFLAMRFLCRMSMKIESKTGAPAASTKESSPEELSPTILRQRALALEMLLSLLTNAGRVLQAKEPFLALIKQHVTVAVSRNGLLTQPILFELALSIFLMVFIFLWIFLTTFSC